MDMNLNSGLRDLNDHRGETVTRSSRERTATAATPIAHRATTPVVCGSGWYHDAAIEQARHDAIEARCNPYG